VFLQELREVDGVDGERVGRVRHDLGCPIEVLVVGALLGLPDPVRDGAGAREKPTSFSAWKTSALTL
jgi:hypothetical protein